MSLQKASANAIAKHDRFIRFIDRHGQAFIYISDIDLLSAEFKRRTGNTLRWVPAPVLYFYDVWVEKESLQLN